MWQTLLIPSGKKYVCGTKGGVKVVTGIGKIKKNIYCLKISQNKIGSIIYTERIYKIKILP